MADASAYGNPYPDIPNNEGFSASDDPADDVVAFSSPGAPDISNPTSGGFHYENPDMFNRDGNDQIEREVTMQEHTTAKEEAMRQDAIAGTANRGGAPQTAPKI